MDLERLSETPPMERRHRSWGDFSRLAIRQRRTVLSRRHHRYRRLPSRHRIVSKGVPLTQMPSSTLLRHRLRTRAKGFLFGPILSRQMRGQPRRQETPFPQQMSKGHAIRFPLPMALPHSPLASRLRVCTLLTYSRERSQMQDLWMAAVLPMLIDDEEERRPEGRSLLRRSRVPLSECVHRSARCVALRWTGSVG